jgi:glycosyltransferase involved in cell wall biosynthesis
MLQRQADDPPGFAVFEVPMSSDYRANKYNFLKRRKCELAYGKELAKLVHDQKPDIILSANTPTEPEWAMIKAAGEAGASFFTWLQDFYSIAVDKLARKKLPLIGALAGKLYQHLDRKCLQASAGIVAITEDFVSILSEFGVPKERVTVIPNWAPLNELPLRPHRNAWSAAHGLDDKFVFLYSGTLAMKHNPDILRRLTVQFENDADVRVVVISEGPGADYLRKCKTAETLGNLEILPFQSFEKMPDILATADVLVAVLEADAGVFSVPSKVLTYLCASRPILAAIPLNNLAARIILKEKSGICVGPADIEGFLEAASKFRGDKFLCEQSGRMARAYAENNFDIQKIADRFEFVLSAKR